jgi:1,4-alpha-glucan branching enzyme
MPTSQQSITESTPMGATRVEGGATFRAWAPEATHVYVITDDLPAASAAGWTPREADLLVRRGDGTWTGFVAGLRDGDPYRFWVVGQAGAGFKRDPWARELGTVPAFPDCDCLIRDPASYPWHDAGFRPPEFRDLILYQLHIGTYFAVDEDGRDTRERRTAKILDLLDRIEYLRDLGVNAIQPLPVQEYPSQFSMGYNGTDYFSPEMDYQVEEEGELRRYLATANRLLAAHGAPPLALDAIRPGPNQLKLVVDLCHLNGIAVLFDLVYNHAGGGFDPQSLYFFDRRRFVSNNDSLYFTNDGWAGGLVFAYWNQWVRQFLIDNAVFFLSEYHVDGIRYDEVTVIDRFGGWRFAQDLAATVRFRKPEAIQIAEYWNDWRWLAVTPAPEGLGFDAALSDRLRDAVRDAVEQASFGAAAAVDVERVAEMLKPPPGFPAAWRAVHCIENQDIVYADRPAHERRPRIAALADGSDPRSWWARSRARLAAGLLLTAPGIPMLFMGQEILEDRNWSDNPRFSTGTLVGWEGLASDRARRDLHAFTRDLLWLRRHHAALRADAVHPYHARNDTRVLAFHRWVEGAGEDVVVVASFHDTTYRGYQLGFPLPGLWREVLNSDFYDHLPNPQVAGNAGGVRADGPPLHGFRQSAPVTIPANGLLVFARA